MGAVFGLIWWAVILLMMPYVVMGWMGIWLVMALAGIGVVLWTLLRQKRQARKRKA